MFGGLLLDHLSHWHPFREGVEPELEAPSLEEAWSLLQLSGTCKAGARCFHSAGLQALVHHLSKVKRCLMEHTARLEEILLTWLQIADRTVAEWPQL